jgi:RNA polymerase sigma factor for flagellar operon FliA
MHLCGRLPDTVELDDLIQVGLMALLEAAKHYSPSKGASFQTYASIRVRGAMLDEVRSNNWAPRSVYKTQRQITAAIGAVENRIGAAAKPDAIAAELGVSLDEYFRMLSTTATARMFSLDQSENNPDIETLMSSGDGSDPCKELESTEFREEIIRAIKSLPERDALVLSLYYDDELNFKEIGAVIGVSESRVCQLHGQALVRVRSHIHESAHEAATGPAPESRLAREVLS